MLRRLFYAAAFALVAAGSQAQPAPTGTLDIAVADDSDNLDPTLARTYASRIIFAGLCDKLLDIDESLNFVPQLALSHTYETPTALVLRLRPGVKFHDGTPMDAASVAASLSRHLTLKGSTRRSEISALVRTEIIDPLTIRLVLKSPSAPFIAQLTDRAGMIMSPRATAAAGAEFGRQPVCAGPFRFVERVAQDHVTLERFPDYWDAGAIHFARVVYRSIPDSTIRFNNLKAGSITLTQGLGAIDVADARADKRLTVLVYGGLGYGAIGFNVANGPAADTVFGRSAKVRKAFELSIDRETLIKVVFNGLYTPVAQAMTPRNPMYNPAVKPLPRDIARARALLAEAGAVPPVPVTLTVVNSPEQLQIGEIIQSMAAEAGFEVRVRATEFASALAAQTRGDFQASAIGWSGRVDPDGNMYNGLYSKGPLNETHYANPDVDKWLDEARLTLDPAERRPLYARITAQVAADMPVMYLYNTAMIMGMSSRLTDFRQVPDGLIRVQGLRLAP